MRHRPLLIVLGRCVHRLYVPWLGTVLACALLVSGGCAKGNQPATPISRDGGATEVVADCEALSAGVQTLYEAAAEKEKVAANLRRDYLEANVKMVMNDCRLRPAVQTECLRKAKDVATLEADCLEYLDDQGTVEGIRFAGGGN